MLFDRKAVVAFFIFLAGCTGGSDEPPSQTAEGALGDSDAGNGARANDTMPTGTFTCRGPSARAFCFGVGVASGECTDRFTLKIRSEMLYGVPAYAAMISMDPNFIDHGSAQMVGTQLNASFRFGRGRGRLLVHLNPRIEDGTWRGTFEEVAYEGPRVRVSCELEPEDDQRNP